MEAISAINIEQCVIGSLIVDESIRHKIEDLSEEMFTADYNRLIYRAMKELHKDKQSLDMQIVINKLNDKGYKIEVNYISNLVAMSQSFSIDSHIKILREKHMRRSIIKSCTHLFEDLGRGKDINTTLHRFENEMNDVLENDKTEMDDSIGQICEKLLDFLGNDEKVNIDFGVKYLDETIGGLFKGELTTIAARSGVGKTALALQIMLNATEQGKKVLFISREMSNIQIFMRNITKKTGITSKDMKSRKLDDSSWEKIVKVMADFNKNELLYINDKIRTVSELKRRIRQVKPDLVIVDYIQLMSSETETQNREREVAGLSREMKNITMDFNIPVIQLSQLNDEMKDFRPWGERPMRDSKAIFHDSNNVIYVHEPVLADFDNAVYTIGKNKSSVLSAKQKGIKLVDMIVAKCRDGQVGFRHYCYNGPRLHFQHIEY